MRLAVVLFLSFLALPFGIRASDDSGSAGHAPRIFGFETGIRQCVHESYSNLGPGMKRLKHLNRTYATALFEFGWRVGGLTGRPASYITIPIQYSWAPAGNINGSSGILAYGWTVRHDLFRTERAVVPFLGYGLLLNQFSVLSPYVKGRMIVQETRFDVGADFRLSSRLKLLVKVEYSMMSYYGFGMKRASAGMASLKTGLHF